MTRAIGTALALVLAVVAWYASPWWPFSLWGREGLFGFELLRPQGDIAASLSRGTPLAPHELILWGIGVFLILTFLQKVWTKLTGV